LLPGPVGNFFSQLNGAIGSATDRAEKTKLVVKNTFTPDNEYQKFDVPVNY
jgi:hypothetical protein